MNNECQVAEFLISRGAEIDATDNRERLTPLHCAVDGCHPKMVELLLRKGANANALTNYQVSPLGKAAAKGRRDLMDLLLTRAAPVEGDLLVAAGTGRIELVEVLLSHGALVNPRKGGRTTPLHVAARCGHLGSVEFLVSNRAKVNVQAEKGRSPLFHSVRSQQD